MIPSFIVVIRVLFCQFTATDENDILHIASYVHLKYALNWDVLLQYRCIYKSKGIETADLALFSQADWCRNVNSADANVNYFNVVKKHEVINNNSNRIIVAATINK